ncbi:Peptide-methionine s-oxide reductase [Globisporangium polare]
MLRRICHHVRLCMPSTSAAVSTGFAGGATAAKMASANQEEEPLNLGEGQDVATFAAGCFWGVELAFQRVHGVVDTKVGYTQGAIDHPTYKQICSGKTGHAEAIRVIFDKNQVTYPQLLDVLWDIHDPTTLNRQKNDHGTQYRSGVYFHSDEQKQAAIASKTERQKLLRKPIVTEILAAKRFWLAESYHQRYLEKGGQCADKGCDIHIRCYG